MSDHTPGPWAISGDETVTVRDTQDGYVALLGWLKQRHVGPCRSAAEVYANARLIAAAPELLEALYIVDACGEPNRVVLYDGEVEGWLWVHPDGREWHEVWCWEDRPPMHPVAKYAIAKAEGTTSC